MRPDIYSCNHSFFSWELESDPSINLLALTLFFCSHAVDQGLVKIEDDKLLLAYLRDVHLALMYKLL